MTPKTKFGNVGYRYALPNLRQTINDWASSTIKFNIVGWVEFTTPNTYKNENVGYRYALPNLRQTINDWMSSIIKN